MSNAGSRSGGGLETYFASAAESCTVSRSHPLQTFRRKAKKAIRVAVEVLRALFAEVPHLIRDRERGMHLILSGGRSAAASPSLVEPEAPEPGGEPPNRAP